MYLHGTNQEHLLGKPASRGCIRFSNNDIVEVFDSLQAGNEVEVRD
ncbi:MAG: L,D-transpeptidase [Bdellovibrionales bacterium]|nr:L,D-transpeptidase [Bdellovibrionales bacterium]